jgi:hypothetical protein
MFMPLSFLLRLDRPFFWPAAGLTPETYINYRRAKNLQSSIFNSGLSGLGFLPAKSGETFCAMNVLVLASLPVDTRQTVGFI